MVAWQFVVALPINALLFGHSLGIDATAADSIRYASGTDAIAMALFGVAHAAVWQFAWTRNRRTVRV